MFLKLFKELENKIQILLFFLWMMPGWIIYFIFLEQDWNFSSPWNLITKLNVSLTTSKSTSPFPPTRTPPPSVSWMPPTASAPTFRTKTVWCGTSNNSQDTKKNPCSLIWLYPLWSVQNGKSNQKSPPPFLPPLSSLLTPPSLLPRFLLSSLLPYTVLSD